MSNFKIIKNSSEITLNNNWVSSTKFNSKDKLVDAKGKAISSSYNGRLYQIIEKRERPISIPKRIGRCLLGTMAVICTLFTALFSKSVRNLFIKKKENMHFAILKSTSQTQTNPTQEEMDPIPEIKEEKKLQLTIPPEVKKTLDQLFEDSPYAIDTLPIYQTALNKEHPRVIRNEMIAPVMKGYCSDGRPFIAIKVDCTLHDEDIENAGLDKDFEDRYKARPQLKDVLCLYQYWGDQPLMWDQERGRSMSPSFFPCNFTCPTDGTIPNDTLKDYFEKVQMLLKTGSIEDMKGLVWSIPAA